MTKTEEKLKELGWEVQYMDYQTVFQKRYDTYSKFAVIGKKNGFPEWLRCWYLVEDMTESPASLSVEELFLFVTNIKEMQVERSVKKFAKNLFEARRKR